MGETGRLGQRIGGLELVRRTKFLRRQVLAVDGGDSAIMPRAKFLCRARRQLALEAQRQVVESTDEEARRVGERARVHQMQVVEPCEKCSP